jgi:hypothetical protein
MAVLSNPDRATVSAETQRRIKSAFGGILKGDLRAAVDATDTWIDSNQTAFNNALPVAARNGMSLQEKTLLFCYVAMKRQLRYIGTH